MWLRLEEFQLVFCHYLYSSQPLRLRTENSWLSHPLQWNNSAGLCKWGWNQVLHTLLPVFPSLSMASFFISCGHKILRSCQENSMGKILFLLCPNVWVNKVQSVINSLPRDYFTPNDGFCFLIPAYLVSTERILISTASMQYNVGLFPEGWIMQ